MKKKNLFTSLCTVAALILFVVVYSGCTKEGPVGPAGTNGTNGLNGTTGIDGINGTDGVDANETCKLCHNPLVVEAKATEYELAKHSWGGAAFEEAGNTSCAPCHESEGFKYVCANNIPATFTLNTTTGKYTNDYASVSSAAYGNIQCGTCHSSKHTTYGASDLPALTTVAAVPMTMWKGTKTINLTQDGGISNLCVKCHQPRPMTTSSTLSNGDVVDYASLAATPSAVWYDSTAGATTNKLNPSYRMHNHYGTVGAIYAGKGGIEFTGSLAYTNSYHTTGTTCQDCHMATMSNAAGGHSFKVRANAGETALSSSTTWNFNGCNATSCHGAGYMTATTAKFATTRADTKNLLTQLAIKINACGSGVDILHKESDPTANLWAGITANNYDGYLDIYSSSSNPNGYWRDPSNTTSTTNLAKPKFPKLTNLQMGAIINFQLCLREYSLGIHNTAYTQALLTNTIEQLTAAGW